MTPPVRNLTVQPLGARREGLLDVAIDAPVAGGTSDAWAVRVHGHVLGRDRPVDLVEAVVPGTVLAAARPTLPTSDVAARHPDVAASAACGFSLLVDTLGLPRHFTFRLRATLGDGSRVKIAAIHGERRPLTTAYEPHLQPLLITSLGRMGTTLLMRLLAAHPAVVTYDRPPFEVRGGKYWLHVLKSLAAPADPNKRIGAPMEFHLESHAAGGNPFYSAEFAAWPQVEAWSGSEYIVDLATFCQRSIDGWYLVTAAAQGEQRDSLRYFAEKHFPDDYPRLMRELYPNARELFLVRDFRDMIASMRAYNTRTGFADFGRARAASDGEWLADLRRALVALRDAWRERGEPDALVRYEDLVRTPETALPPLLGLLGVDTSPARVAEMIEAARPGAPELRGHGTATSPDASIGRWRRDLSPELQVAVTDTFGDVLQEFGYALSADTTTID